MYEGVPPVHPSSVDHVPRNGRRPSENNKPISSPIKSNMTYC
jgi:hypothetical protein